MAEYIDMQMNHGEMEIKLTELIKEYCDKTKKQLIIYSVNFQQMNNLPIELNMDDFYTIRDLLRNDNSKSLSFYIETPGGSGEVAEEIATFLRKNYNYVDFLVAGECKSAGTILTMCGDEICLNETGSLGPIDAQIKIGRHFGSAHDYMKWVEDKMDEADEKGSLNNFDALMVAQISPDELIGVENNLEYGKELVRDFLKKYKFKNWEIKETSGIEVTDEIREERANEIADKLANHSLWKSHGRSLKIDTLTEDIKLKIKNINEDEKISEIIERIHVLLRLIFSSGHSYKIIATKDTKLVKTAVEVQMPVSSQPSMNINISCNQCGSDFPLYVNFSRDSRIDKELQEQGRLPFPKNSKIICECGEKLDLSEVRKQIEIDFGKFIYD